MAHRRTVLAGALGAATLASLSTPGQASASSWSRGPLVLVGGSLSDSNTDIYGEIVRRAGGADAHIGVITAASIPPSQDPDAGTPDANNSAFNGAYYADLLRSHGAGKATWLPIDLDNITASDDPGLTAQIDTMTGFFFGGGDQYRYVTTMLHGDAHTDSAALAAIRRRHDAGAVIAGTSAGAQIQQGADMVTGGESYEALRDGSHPGYFDDPDASGYLPAGGFGFLTSGLIDTHFSAYGRLGRAIQLAQTTRHSRVYGLDPNTALVVTAPGTPLERGHVVGAGGISVLDLREGVRWDYLAQGFEYATTSWRPIPAPDVRPLFARNTQAPEVNPDIFGDYQARDLALTLAASKAATAVGYTRQSDPMFAVTLTKPHGFTAYTRDGAAAVAFTGLRVSINRV